MAITLAQAFAHAIYSSGTSLGATFGSATTTGNTLVLVTFYYASPLATVSSVSINNGAATFTRLGGQVGSVANGYASIDVWIAPNITGGAAPTVTVTYSGTLSTSDVAVYELSGMPSSTTTDGTASGLAQTTATALSSPAITTTNAGSIIFALFSPSQAVTAGQAGWTMNILTDNSAGSEYKIQTATQTGLVATATQSPTGPYGTYIFALKPVSSGTTQLITVTVAAGATMGGGVKKVVKTSITI